MTEAQQAERVEEIAQAIEDLRDEMVEKLHEMTQLFGEAADLGFRMTEARYEAYVKSHCSGILEGERHSTSVESLIQELRKEDEDEDEE